MCRLTTPPAQTGDRALQAGTESINNRAPSRQDWQLQEATNQLRQERRSKRQTSPRPDSNRNHGVQQQSQQKNHKHTCTRSCTNTHSSHGSLGAVIIIYREQLGPRSPSFIWFLVIMICDHHHSGLIKEHQGDSQQVCFLHPQAKHLMSQLGKYPGS